MLRTRAALTAISMVPGLRAVIQPPCPIGIMEYLVVVLAFQHRRNAERICRPCRLEYPLDQVMNTLYACDNFRCPLKERRRLNGAEVRHKRAKNTHTLGNVVAEWRRHRRRINRFQQIEAILCREAERPPFIALKTAKSRFRSTGRPSGIAGMVLGSAARELAPAGDIPGFAGFGLGNGTALAGNEVTLSGIMAKERGFGVNPLSFALFLDRNGTNRSRFIVNLSGAAAGLSGNAIFLYRNAPLLVSDGPKQSGCGDSVQIWSEDD